MTQPRNLTATDIQSLAELRDQLALQAHLFKAEAKDRWRDLEAKWLELQAQLKRAGVAATDSRHEISAAGRELAEALREGYTQIKHALKS